MPVPARLTWVRLAGAAAVAGVLGLIWLTAAIHSGGLVVRLDERTLALVDRLRTPALVQVFSVLTWAGNFLFASLALLVVCGRTARRRRTWSPVWLGGAAVLALGVTVGTGKQVIARSRVPFAAGAFGDGGTSYPSGHTTTAVVVGGCLVLLAGPTLAATRRRLAWAAVVGYAAVIGASRLYLRQHWLSDVLAGYLLGTVIVCAVAVLSHRPGRLRRWAPAVAADHG